MIKPAKEKIQNAGGAHSQAGIALVTAVMVLASVSAISFAVSIFSLRELRASRQQAYSEPAIVSAEAGAETTLFFRMRKLASFNTNCPDSSSALLPSGQSGFSSCNQFYDDPYIFGTHHDSNEMVILNDPSNPSSMSAGYQRMMVTATSSVNSINLMRLDIYDMDDPASGPLFPQPTVTVGGATVNVNLNPAKSYAVILVPLPTGVPGSVSGYIRGMNASGLVMGIPSKSPTISSTGSRQGLLRKLEVLLKR